MSALDSFKNIHAWYESHIPSTGKKVHYRAMVMKENMEIALALSEDAASGLETVYTILESCIKEEINIKSLEIFDIEWFVLQMQKKSQGETKTLTFPCEECKEESDVNISINNLYVKGLENASKLKKIDLGNDTFLEINYPSMEIKTLIESLDDQTEDVHMAALVEICAQSISKVYNLEDVTEFEEVSLEDWKDFILSQDIKVLEKFSEFFKTMPKCIIKSEWKCPHCNKDNNLEISDINNFF